MSGEPAQYDRPAPLVSYRSGFVYAEIVEADGFELRWTDYVANDWSEPYPSLALAVVRLGLVIAAVEDDRLFRDLPSDFAARVIGLAAPLAAFVDDALEPPV